MSFPHFPDPAAPQSAGAGPSGSASTARNSNPGGSGSGSARRKRDASGGRNRLIRRFDEDVGMRDVTNRGRGGKRRSVRVLLSNTTCLCN